MSFNQKPILKTMMFCHSISSTITMMKIMIRRSILFQIIWGGLKEHLALIANLFWSSSFESRSNSLHCNCENAVYKVVIHKQISPWKEFTVGKRWQIWTLTSTIISFLFDAFVIIDKGEQISLFTIISISFQYVLPQYQSESFVINTASFYVDLLLVNQLDF